MGKKIRKLLLEIDPTGAYKISGDTSIPIDAETRADMAAGRIDKLKNSKYVEVRELTTSIKKNPTKKIIAYNIDKKLVASLQETADRLGMNASNAAERCIEAYLPFLPLELPLLYGSVYGTANVDGFRDFWQKICDTLTQKLDATAALINEFTACVSNISDDSEKLKAALKMMESLKQEYMEIRLQREFQYLQSNKIELLKHIFEKQQEQKED